MLVLKLGEPLSYSARTEPDSKKNLQNYLKDEEVLARSKKRPLRKGAWQQRQAIAKALIHGQVGGKQGSVRWRRCPPRTWHVVSSALLQGLEEPRLLVS